MVLTKLEKIDIQNFKVKRPKREQYDLDTDIRVRQMYNRLMLVAVSVFEWKNLPDSVDEIYLEKMLIRNGSMLFFQDENMVKDGEGEGEHLTLKFMPSYKRDVYGQPILRRAYADDYTKYRKNLTSQNSVIIYDNVLEVSFSYIIYDFAQHLVDIENIIKMNLEHQRLPYIIGASDEIKQELEVLFSQKRRNKPYFIVKDHFAQEIRELFQHYQTNVEFIGDKLQDYKDAVWNEFMVMIGIGTNASPKRERLVASEVDSVNEQSEVFARSRLKSRQRACKLINSMFGLNVEVDYDFGGVADGTVHNNSTVNSKEFSKSET